MAEIRIAGAQLPVGRDIGANLTCVLRALDSAREADADVLLTPEGSLSGYTHLFDRRGAEEALGEVTARSAELGVALALGTCRYEADGLCYDELRFYDSTGTFLGYHAKILLTGTLSDPPRGEIEHFGVGQLRAYDLKGIRVGGLVCNDLWANPECTPQPDPHLTHTLAHLGARVIFHCVNGGRDASTMSQVVVRGFHESNLRMRARADGIFIATADSASPLDLGVSSPGGIVGPDGEWITRAPTQGEHFYVSTIRVP